VIRQAEVITYPAHGETITSKYRRVRDVGKNGRSDGEEGEQRGEEGGTKNSLEHIRRGGFYCRVKTNSGKCWDVEDGHYLGIKRSVRLPGGRGV